MIIRRTRVLGIALAGLAATSCTPGSRPLVASRASSAGTPEASSVASAPATPPTLPSATLSAARPARPQALTVQRTTRPVQFATPSGNILCMVDVDALCKESKHRWRAPARPSRCDPLAYGDTLVLVRSGSRSEFLCEGDNTFFGATPVLAYARAWRYRNTECVSERTGVTCTNVATGHGFFTSVDRYRLF